jgi:hypothetical protein
MACELTVVIENRPGSFAALGEAIGNAGMNIVAICGFTWEEKKIVHILVKNSTEGRRALENAGFMIEGERDVLVINIEDQPGQFGKICRQLAVAGINTNLIYLASKQRLVLGVDDFSRARTILGLAARE